MTKARLLHIALGALAAGLGIGAELLTTSKWAHAAWAPGVLVFLSWLGTEIKAATTDLPPEAK